MSIMAKIYTIMCNIASGNFLYDTGWVEERFKKKGTYVFL